MVRLSTSIMVVTENTFSFVSVSTVSIMKEIRNSLRKNGISVSIKTGNSYNQG